MPQRGCIKENLRHGRTYVLYVLPEGTKPVKLFFEGQTRARDLDSQQTQDMTIDAVVESKIGTAIIVDSLVGKYTIV